MVAQGHPSALHEHCVGAVIVQRGFCLAEMISLLVWCREGQEVCRRFLRTAMIRARLGGHGNCAGF